MRVNDLKGRWIIIDATIDHPIYYVPTSNSVSQIRFYPDDKILVIEEKNKYFDDHAVAIFNVQTAEQIDTIIGCLTKIKTT